ncbi:hypothetical protein [Candidatus Entotheonella palauensis]|uniref:hypothetical protein n=1 Tax=Candidatus Entotheonella palauensis TaxID=93172 RepID=UPI0011787830|nr:hypothetical protein [Candidatus Entotheonella palauensis]
MSRQEPLPPLPDEAYDFNKLPSAFTSHAEKQSTRIVEGPNGTNVFYAIGTAEDMRVIGYPYWHEYGERPQDWNPFLEYPGATIELVTREGLNAAGQKTYCDLGLPQYFFENIELAKNRNSPVLIIIDRRALQINTFKDIIRKYYENSHPHVGLVTGGGADISDKVLAEMCEFEFPRGEEHHIWEAPRDRSSYTRSVTEVVRGIRQKLPRIGTPVIEVSPRRKPGLHTQFGI